MRRTIFAMAAAVLLTACISSSPQSRFYTLFAKEPGAGTVRAAIGDEWVGIGPIDIPSYLDRPQVVTRGEGHRLVVHEFDRWADPLKDRVLDVLMENVVSLSDSKRVAPYPWPSAFRPDHRVTGEINAFEAGPTGEVVLKTRWTVQLVAAPESIKVRMSEYREPADPDDFNSVAAAMSRALARWSVDIASALSESVAQ
ncbi:MAG: PqiC family protein [Gammaproteobacteria bacterium]